MANKYPPISNEEIQLIKELKGRGFTYSEITQRVKRCRDTVSKILKGPKEKPKPKPGYFDVDEYSKHMAY